MIFIDGFTLQIWHHYFLLLISFTSKYPGLSFLSYPLAASVGSMIPQVPYNNVVNYGPNGYAAAGGGRYQNNKVRFCCPACWRGANVASITNRPGY